MQGIAEWLASIGLEEYAQRFGENAIDISVVRDLTEQDLKDLGVLLGHRRKLLRAIAELKGDVLRPPQTATKPAPRDGAERRQLTVMFCDLVGSSALSVRLDPEDLRAVIGTYHGCIAEVIARNEGVIARYMGDGVLAYFGYPHAHEDDAEQATRAGLALIDAVAHLQTDIGTGLQVRVGRHDGEGDRLERFIEEIAVEVVTSAEIIYRENCVRAFEWRLQRKAQPEEEARQQQVELECEARERQQQLDQARIDRLFDEAASLRRATDTRAYVDAVKAIVASKSTSVSPDAIERWSTWAHAQADRIDPVRSARFLEGISGDEDTK